MRRLVSPDPAVAVLAVLLVAGVALRGWMMATWHPAVVGYYDTSAYVSAARTNLFGDEFRPAGYPMLLWLLHGVTPRVWLVLAVQHALGIATAGVLYLLVHEATGSRWLGIVPAAIVLLDALQVIVEHAILSDSPFVFLLAASLYAAQRAARSPRPPLWAAGAGTLMAAAALTRTVGMFLLPVILLAVLWPGGRGRRPRLYATGACAAAIGVVIAGYLALGAAVSGHPVPLAKASGWALYARVGQFADCRQFTPPAGTRRLCQKTPPARRPSTDFYFWSSGSPARRHFGTPPAGDALIGAFARAAVLHQPMDYAATVACDFSRYLLPMACYRKRAGQTQGQFLSLSLNRSAERKITKRLAKYYRGVGHPRQHEADITVLYARVARVEYVLMALVLLLAAVAPLVVRPGRRAVATTAAAAGFLLLLVPVATQVYDARYAVAALGPLAVAAALGGDAAARRLSRFRLRMPARPPLSASRP